MKLSLIPCDAGYSILAAVLLGNCTWMCTPPIWAPGGSLLVFQSASTRQPGVWVASLLDSFDDVRWYGYKHRRLTPSAAGYGVSADGSTLVVTNAGQTAVRLWRLLQGMPTEAKAPRKRKRN